MRRLLAIVILSLLATPALAAGRGKGKKPPKPPVHKPDDKKPDEPKPDEPKPDEPKPDEPPAKPEPRPDDKSKADAKPDEPAPAAPITDSDAADIDALRKEYDGIREKLFTSRARAAAVGDALYSTRVEVHLRYGSGRFFSVKRATIRLDGANVFDDSAGAIADGTSGDATRFEGFVAPGKHVMTIRIEAQSKDDDRVVSATEDTFSFDAPQDRDVIVTAKADDGGDMGWSWKRKQHGSYRLHLDIGIDAKKPAAAQASGAGNAKK